MAHPFGAYYIPGLSNLLNFQRIGGQEIGTISGSSTSIARLANGCKTLFKIGRFMTDNMFRF